MTIIAKISYQEFVQRIAAAPNENIAEWWQREHLPQAHYDPQLALVEPGHVFDYVLRTYVDPTTVPKDTYNLFDHQWLVTSKIRAQTAATHVKIKTQVKARNHPVTA